MNKLSRVTIRLLRTLLASMLAVRHGARFALGVKS